MPTITGYSPPAAAPTGFPAGMTRPVKITVANTNGATVPTTGQLWPRTTQK